MNEKEFSEKYAQREESITVSPELREKTANFICRDNGGLAKSRNSQDAPSSNRTSIQKRVIVGISIAAACILGAILGISLPKTSLEESLDPVPFSVVAYAATSDTLLGQSDEGMIVFESANGYGTGSNFEQEGIFSECYFSVIGDGITRVQASTTAGTLYRATFEDYVVKDAETGEGLSGEELARYKELLGWNAYSRGLYEFYSDYDSLSVRGMGVSPSGKNPDLTTSPLSNISHMQFSLAKLLGATVDVEVQENEAVYFGLWTNDPAANEGNGLRLYDYFDGAILTVTVEFDDGTYATQIIDLHAGLIKCEVVAPGDSSMKSVSRVISEVVEPPDTFSSENASYSLYGVVRETNTNPFPLPLENANELASRYLYDQAGSLISPTEKANTKYGDEVFIDPSDIHVSDDYIEVVEYEFSEEGFFGHEQIVDESVPYEEPALPEFQKILVGYSGISLERHKRLPEYVSLVDTWFGDDYGNIHSWYYVYGIKVGRQGEIPEGYSYISMSIDITNPNDYPITKSLGLNTRQLAGGGEFAMLDDSEGRFTYAQPGATVWCSAWVDIETDLFNAKEAVSIELAPGETKRLSTITLLPDYIIEHDSLMYVVSTGEDLDNDAAPYTPKAYFIADQI